MIKNEKVFGTILSYCTVILQVLINIFFTPFLINAMGLTEYGLYETINSFGTTLLVINFGVSSVVSRYIVKYKNDKRAEKLENFLFMSFIISFVIFIIILLIGLIASNFIPFLYKDSLSIEQISKAKYMFMYIMVNLALMSWHNFTNGIIVGNEKFVFASVSKLLKQILRVSILTVLIIIGIDAVSVVITNLIVTSVIILTEAGYCKFMVKTKIKYHFLDKLILKEVFLFSVASIIQTITNQINLTLDKVILGIMLSPEIVAKYAIGMLIVAVFVSVMQIISGVYLPDATKLVLKKADGIEMTNFVVKPGRIQAIIGCAVVFGFLLIGKEFLCIWVGSKFKEIWLSTSILLIFTMISYVTSVANVILDAMLKKIYRSLILVVTAILNVIITVILIPILGYLGAAIGTAISMLIGNIILLNIYYSKQIGIHIKKMYIDIFKGILLSSIIAFIAAYIFKFIISGITMRFIVCFVIFVFVYFGMLLKYGLNEEEVSLLNNYKKKLIK